MQSSKSGSVTVTAVAPVYNRRELTLQCIRSLKRLALKNIDLRIIIVNDGSTDGTGEAVKSQFPDVLVIDGDGSLWYSEGTNVGIRRALELGTDYVWQINDDQVFDSEALTSLVEAATRFPDSAVGSVLLLWDTPHKVFQVAPVWDWRLGGWRHWQNQTVWTLPDGPFTVDMIVGNSMLVPAEAYNRAGLLDSERFPMLGDGEFSPRLRRNGYELLIAPGSRVFCLPNTPPERLSKMNPRKLWSALFADARKPHNLRRRLRMCVSTAPSKFEGLLAFAAFCLRVLLRRSVETSWANSLKEPELRELFPAKS